METNNVIRGEFFIIPNQIIDKDEEMVSKKRINNILSAYDGIDNENERYLVQIWATDTEPGGCENWSCHYKDLGLNGEKYFPDYIPLSLIKDLKEGDTVRFKVYGVDIELKAAQLKYRYHRFGKFENVLKGLVGC